MPKNLNLSIDVLFQMYSVIGILSFFMSFGASKKEQLHRTTSLNRSHAP